MPEIQINCLAVTIAAIVNVVFGFVWFTIIFGRAWANEMGFDPDGKKETSEILKTMALMVVGNFFIAWEKKSWKLFMINCSYHFLGFCSQHLFLNTHNPQNLTLKISLMRKQLRFAQLFPPMIGYCYIDSVLEIIE